MRPLLVLIGALACQRPPLPVQMDATGPEADGAAPAVVDAPDAAAPDGSARVPDGPVLDALADRPAADVRPEGGPPPPRDGAPTACVAQRSESCDLCFAQALTGACAAEWAALRREPCGPSVRCAEEYCLCGRAPCRGDLCACSATCLPPTDRDGCGARWQRVLECLGRTCAGRC